MGQASTRRTLGKGAYPDALLKSDTLDLKANENGIVWVTVTVPEDIEPGLYEFYLIVSADDEIWEEFHVVLGVPQ